MLSKISRILIYAAIFLVPLVSLPFTVDVVDSPKQFVLLALMLAAFFLWVSGMVLEKKVAVRYDKFSLFVLALWLSALVSSVFSLYRYGSFWGYPLSSPDSLATLSALVIFYFLVVNLFEKKDIKNLFLTFIASGTLAVIYGLLQFLGLHMIPLNYAKNNSFNTVGTLGSLAFFTATLLSAVIPFLIFAKGRQKIVLAACAAFFAVSLIFYNVIYSWIALGLGLLAAFVFLMGDSESALKNRTARILIFSGMALSVIFICVNFFSGNIVSSAYQGVYKKLGITGQYTEISLSYAVSSRIAFDSARQSVKNLLIGSGMGTFVYDYMRFKPLEIVQNDFAWNKQFTSSASEVINTVATRGFLGLASLLALMGWAIYQGFRAVKGEKNEIGIELAVFSGLVSAVAALFIYSPSVSGFFSFWLLLALTGLMCGSKAKAMEFKSAKAVNIVSVAIIILLIIEIMSSIWSFKRYYAEAQYLQTLKEVQTKNYDSAIKSMLLSVAATQGMQDNYLTDLTQIYLLKAGETSAKLTQQGAAADKIANAISPDIAKAVEYSQNAAEKVNPNNPVNWLVRGDVLMKLVMMGAGGDPSSWAQKSLEKAISLEPLNSRPWFQIGQLYLVKNDLDTAKEKLQKAIEITPKYSDARYYLGLINDQQGDKQLALAQFTIIAQLNPDNQTVKQIIKNLQAGDPAFGKVSQDSNSKLPAQSPDLSEKSLVPGILDNATGSGN